MILNILLTVLALSTVARGAVLPVTAAPDNSSIVESGPGEEDYSSEEGLDYDTTTDNSEHDDSEGEQYDESELDEAAPRRRRSADQASQGFSLTPFYAPSNVQTNSAPRYEQHSESRVGVVPITTTITSQVTQTHTLRVPSTSDVWVTSVTMMKMPVTQLTTQRSFVPEAANTITSVIRITKTPIAVVTRTEEIYPTKTLVSVFTRFVTVTETVELWQNIVHRATNYEVLTVPVVETQTLLQHLFVTTTVTRRVNITSVQPLVTQPIFPRAGQLTQRVPYLTLSSLYTYGR